MEAFASGSCSGLLRFGIEPLMDGNLSVLHAGLKTRRRPCWLTVRAESENRRAWNGGNGLWTTRAAWKAPVDWLLLPHQPPAENTTAVTRNVSERQRRMLFPMAAGELRSIGRPDFTGLPEQSP